jgi:hypothetical protein
VEVTRIRKNLGLILWWLKIGIWIGIANTIAIALNVIY